MGVRTFAFIRGVKLHRSGLTHDFIQPNEPVFADTPHCGKQHRHAAQIIRAARLGRNAGANGLRKAVQRFALRSTLNFRDGDRFKGLVPRPSFTAPEKHEDNRALSGVEYVSKYNTGHDVPFVTYPWIHGHPGKEQIWIQTSISSSGRGVGRSGWDLIYNHYVNRRGMAAPFTAEYAEITRPEGGGYGNSGGYDGLGFTTLTHSLEPIEKGAPPSALRPVVEGRQVTLSWAGTANALGYELKRSTSKSGPYTTVATADDKELFAVDTGLEPRKTYYYVVSARPRTGSRLESAPIAVTATRQLLGKIIGTEGSSGNAGAGKETAFDGYLGNFFDGPEGVSWAGLDLGSGLSAVITEVKYCPRQGSAKRMVGGKFQGSSSEDFTVGVTDLHKITKEPPEGEFTTQPINSNMAFRYVRYVSPEGGYGNVAELQFFGDLKGAAFGAR